MALGATLGSFRLAASGAVWYRPFNGSLDLDVPFDFAKGSPILSTLTSVG